MKYLVALSVGVLMLLATGCAVEEPYGGTYGVYGEYPYTYGYAPVYTYPYYDYGYHHYYRHYRPPYDRDHYWDRWHYGDRHRYPYRHDYDWR